MDPEHTTHEPEVTATAQAPARREEDAAYIERLKADMRRAAAAREHSEATVKKLEEQLGALATQHRLHLAALQAGCLDPEGLLGAARAKGLFVQPPDSGQTDEWLARLREAMPYFFTATRLHEADATQGAVHAGRPGRPALNTQQQAARAYLR